MLKSKFLSKTSNILETSRQHEIYKSLPHFPILPNFDRQKTLDPDQSGQEHNKGRKPTNFFIYIKKMTKIVSHVITKMYLASIDYSCKFFNHFPSPTSKQCFFQTSQTIQTQIKKS